MQQVGLRRGAGLQKRGGREELPDGRVRCKGKLLNQYLKISVNWSDSDYGNFPSFINIFEY